MISKAIISIPAKLIYNKKKYITKHFPSVIPSTKCICLFGKTIHFIYHAKRNRNLNAKSNYPEFLGFYWLIVFCSRLTSNEKSINKIFKLFIFCNQQQHVIQGMCTDYTFFIAFRLYNIQYRATDPKCIRICQIWVHGKVPVGVKFNFTSSASSPWKVCGNFYVIRRLYVKRLTI